MTGIKDWSTTAADNGAGTNVVPHGAEEGWAPADVNAWGRETMAQVKGFRDTLEWRDWSHTITFVSATSFSTGASLDTTTIYLAGRRVRAVGSSTGTIYGTVSSSSGTNPTTVVVDWDSTGLVSEALVVSLGLSPTGNAWDKTTQDNWLINPDFHIWQRGTSFTATGFTADRWELRLGAGAAATLTQVVFTVGQTDVPHQPRYYVNIDRTTAGTERTRLIQYVEDVRGSDAKTFTFSFWAKCTTGTYNLSTGFVQDFGTTGSTEVASTPVAHVLTTTWTKFTNTTAMPSISGKTISGGGSHWRVRFLWDETEGAAESPSEIQIALCKVEEGSSATQFSRRPWQQELALCQRYYEKTFNMATTPAQGGSDEGPLAYRVQFYNAGNVQQGIYWNFAVTKKSAPTITVYNPESANALAYNVTRSTDSGLVTPEQIGTKGAHMNLLQTEGDQVADLVIMHATADAEISP